MPPQNKNNRPSWNGDIVMHPVLKQGPWNETLSAQQMKLSPWSEDNDIFDHYEHVELSRPANDGYIDTLNEAIYLDNGTNIPKAMRELVGTHIIRRILLSGKRLSMDEAKEIGSQLMGQMSGIVTWTIETAHLNSLTLVPLIDGSLSSNSLTTVSLKNNPLGPNAAASLFRLISTTSITTLDLESTELGDLGVASLFAHLTTARSGRTFKLKWLSLTACGVGYNASVQIGKYLESPSCHISTLHLDCNALKDANGLVRWMSAGSSLECLSLRSCGLTSSFDFVLAHIQYNSKIRALDLGQSDKTRSTGQHYNYLTDGLAYHLAIAIRERGLSCLLLGDVPMSRNDLVTIMKAAACSNEMLAFSANPLLRDGHGNTEEDCEKYDETKITMQRTLVRNVRRKYGCTYNHYLTHLRHRLFSPSEEYSPSHTSRSEVSTHDSGFLVQDPCLRLVQGLDDSDNEWDKLDIEDESIEI